MTSAFRVIWWDRKDGEESITAEVLVVTDKIDDVVELFKQHHPSRDTAYISTIELVSSKVILG